MPTFVLMTKLSADSMRDLKHRENMGKEWFETVKQKCPDVNWIAHYALLGPYDFMDVYEAPDDETATKVSLITMAKGAVTAESWPAIQYQKFLDIAEEIAD